MWTIVHGDIRHLENSYAQYLKSLYVHGDIRHLENTDVSSCALIRVHGDIRHLEIEMFVVM